MKAPVEPATREEFREIILKAMPRGFQYLYNVSGGMTAWGYAGYEVTTQEEGNEKSLPG